MAVESLSNAPNRDAMTQGWLLTFAEMGLCCASYQIAFPNIKPDTPVIAAHIARDWQAAC